MARQQLGTATARDLDAVTKNYVDPRVTTIASSPIPVFSIEKFDCLDITELAENIEDMSAGMTGTPRNFWRLMVRIYSTGVYTIHWGSRFIDGVAHLPTTTQPGMTLQVGCEYNVAKATFVCLASGVVTN